METDVKNILESLYALYPFLESLQGLSKIFFFESRFRFLNSNQREF